MNGPKKILPVMQLIYRQALRNSSSEALPVTGRYSKFAAKKAQLGIENDVPVHIKAGFGDKAMVAATWGLAIVGTGLALQTFVNLVLGKKE